MSKARATTRALVRFGRAKRNENSNVVTRALATKASQGLSTTATKGTGGKLKP